MDIILYNFNKRENSTKQPTGGVTRSVLLKESTSIYSPTFILSGDPTTYNYVKWGSRYYYIRDIAYVHNTTWEIACEIDVLATWKNDIGNTSAFMQYATQGFNVGIPDGRLSTVDTASVQESSLSLFSSDSGAGTYILQYATASATKGPAGVLWLSNSEAKIVSQELNTTGFNEFLENSVKQLVGAYDALISCRYVPLSWYAVPTSGGSQNVVLAGYNTGAVGMTPADVLSYTGSITIPWQFSDFRNLSPYTSLLLYLPAYGFIELNPADLIGKSSIEVIAYCDGITGDVFYIVDNLARASSNISSPVAIGTTGTNSFGVAGGLIRAVGAGASGNLPLAGAELFGTFLASQQRDYGVCGSNGGVAGILASVGSSSMQVKLFSICHNTSDNPADMASVYGRPKMAVATPSAGYNQCVEASVNCNAPDNLKQKINAYLNGGFFYE